MPYKPYEFRRDDLYAFAMHIHADTKEKGNELYFRYCPYCDGGDSKDKQTFSVNMDSGTFHCFRASCGKSGHFVELARDFGFHLDFGDSQKPKYKRLKQKPVEVRDKAVEYLASRGIGKEIAEKYHITVRTDNDNVLVFPFFDENGVLVSAKYRKTDFDKSKDKNKEWWEKDTKPILFGMLQATDKTKPLIITEGQLDSLSVAECGIDNAVSVPGGATNMNWIAQCKDWIEQFTEIVFFGDGDSAGQKMLQPIVDAFPKMRIRIVRQIDYLGVKDANDILRKFGKDAIIKCVENAEPRKVSVVKPLDAVQAIDLSALPKIMTGFYDIDRMIGGMYYGQLIVLTGKRGEGKSTLASNIIANVLDQGEGVFVYSGELPDYHFKNWLDLQIAGSEHVKQREDGYGGFEYYLGQKTIATITNWYAGRAFIYDNTATFTDGKLPALIETIEEAVSVNRLRFVLIDNLMTAFSNEAKDFYQEQGKFMKQLKRLALKTNTVILLVAHPRKEIGNALDNDSVSGTSVVTDIADVVITYSRNTDDDYITYQSLIGITKNRMTGKILVGDNRAKVMYSEASKRIGGKNDNLKKVYGCFRKNSEIPDEPPF